MRIDAELALRRSIAVMPFTDLSEPKAPHFAEGIMVELITDLGRLRDSLVIASPSSALLGSSADVDVRRVGRELKVRHVLTGSARRDGDRVKLTAQLTRTDTGALLWTERFDYADVASWNWRRDISQRIAATLDIKVDLAMIDQAVQMPRSSAAIDHWMRGAHLLRHFTTRAELQRGTRAFRGGARGRADVDQRVGRALVHSPRQRGALPVEPGPCRPDGRREGSGATSAGDRPPTPDGPAGVDECPPVRQ